MSAAEPTRLEGEVWRSPVMPDGSVYAVVRLDDGMTLAARWWAGNAWVGIIVARWLLEGIAAERARAEQAEAYLAQLRAAFVDDHETQQALRVHAEKRAEQAETRLAAVREAAEAYPKAQGEEGIRKARMAVIHAALATLDWPEAKSGRCPATDTAGDGGPVRCDLNREHTGDHEADYSGPLHALRTLVHRWPNEMGLEACGCADGLCMRHGTGAKPDRGTLINEAASLGAAAVKAREAAERMPDDTPSQMVARELAEERAADLKRRADEAWARVRAMAEAAHK